MVKMGWNGLPENNCYQLLDLQCTKLVTNMLRKSCKIMSFLLFFIGNFKVTGVARDGGRNNGTALGGSKN